MTSSDQGGEARERAKASGPKDSGYGARPAAGRGERLDSISSMTGSLVFGSGAVDIVVDIPVEPNDPAPTNFELYGASGPNPENGTALSTSAGRPSNNRLAGNTGYTANQRFYVAVTFDQPYQITLVGSCSARDANNGGRPTIHLA